MHLKLDLSSYQVLSLMKYILNSPSATRIFDHLGLDYHYPFPVSFDISIVGLLIYHFFRGCTGISRINSCQELNYFERVI